MHERGLIHKDIKPENILLSGAGDHLEAMVADFGISQRGPTTTVSPYALHPPLCLSACAHLFIVVQSRHTRVPGAGDRNHRKTARQQSGFICARSDHMVAVSGVDVVLLKGTSNYPFSSRRDAVSSARPGTRTGRRTRRSSHGIS